MGEGQKEEGKRDGDGRSCCWENVFFLKGVAVLTISAVFACL